MRTVTLTLGRIRRHIATGAASVDELGDEITGGAIVLQLTEYDSELPGASLQNYIDFLRRLGAKRVACKHFQAGYAGQRYEVRAEDEDGKPFVMGWTNQKDGGALAFMAKRHPSWSNPVVKDLGENPEERKPNGGKSPARID